MINSFRGEYAWLSNFARVPIRYGEILYPTLEHAFQAAKFPDEETKRHIASLKTPVEAKRYAQIKKTPKGFGAVRLEVMEVLLRIKFNQPAFRDLLLATGEEELVEGNDWGDKFWGVCNGEGSNNLGKLIMKIREELRNEQTNLSRM